MKQFRRRSAWAVLLAIPLFSGCANDVCKRLVFESEPVVTPPLVMPEGVPAIAEGAEYRVPGANDATAIEGCLAKPPMTLPPAALETPEEGEEEA